MKIPPKKPHFFKPIQPGFKNGLKIPLGFLKYLKGHDHIEHAILKRDGNKWPMKVKGHRFEGGWAEFVQQHDLQLGDILMFRHEGNMEFEVSIFDSTHCDREYAEYLQEGEEISKIFKFEERSRRKNKSSKKASSHVKAATHHKSFGHSHIECTIREYSCSRRFLYIPRQFVYANGLTNKKCDLIIRDDKQRSSWNLKLGFSGSRPYIGGGWPKFRADNCLTKGDRIMFEVITNGETPIWKFQVTNRETPLQKFQERSRCKNKSSKKASSLVKAATHHKSFGHSQIECTIREYCYSRRFLYIPRQFVYANGLTNKKCDLIIRDDKQRSSWNVKLSSSGSSTYIGSGWPKFRADNCLNKGDRLMFEVITNGETPIWKFQVTNRETPLQKFQERPRRKIKSSKKAYSHVKAAIHHKSFGHSHFECTIREYCFSHGYVVLPQQFTYANGLTNKKCGLIIRDEGQRLWNLKLSSSKSCTYIGGGWTKFCADNCLRKGDRIMFEVITNGETPIWKFQVTNRETPLLKFQGKCSGKVAKREEHEAS